MFDVKYMHHGFEFLVFPAGLKDVPLPMSKFQKEDGSYYSVSMLEAEYPTIKAVNIIDDRFLVLNFGFANEEDIDERALIKQYLEANGMVNMRKGATLETINWAVLQGNEFGLFADWEMASIPSVSLG